MRVVFAVAGYWSEANVRALNVTSIEPLIATGAAGTPTRFRGAARAATGGLSVKRGCSGRWPRCAGNACARRRIIVEPVFGQITSSSSMRPGSTANTAVPAVDRNVSRPCWWRGLHLRAARRISSFDGDISANPGMVDRAHRFAHYGSRS